MVGFTIFASSFASESKQIPIFAFVSLPMALFSVLGGVLNHRREKKKYTTQVELRKERYQQYLKDMATELTFLVQLQRDANFTAHPDLRQCLEFARSLVSTKLWERENGDPDFLDGRLGIGEMLSTFTVEVPPQSQFQLTPDPLEEQARALPKAYGRIANSAVALQLADIGAAGFVGRRETLINTVRALLLHLIAHHSPSEVKVVVLSPESETGEWNWVRWMPQNWSDGREVRFFGNSKATQASVLTYLETVLKQRKNQIGENDSGSHLLAMPVFVVVWGDVQLWRGPDAIKFAPLVDMILKDGKGLGVYSLFLSEQIARVPKACDAVVDLSTQPAILRLVGTTPQKFSFTPDAADRALAWQFAQALSAIRLTEAGGGAANLPPTTTLLELLEEARVEDLDVLEFWKLSDPTKNLGVPIGIGAGGKKLYLNLHEKGHGPHGLVAGTTGSGKTALLSTYLAVASLLYHPHELGFIGIDFKGGDLVRDLRDLPHMIGVMTNLESSGTGRAIKILRGEIKKRQGLFNAAGIGNIYDYQAMRRKGEPKASQPMPHLVIVCDEFAELKKEQPEFIRELVSISRVGRSLGIHLILATQKPAGVISDEIWSNSHFHLCLKVASIEDSREMLRRPEAADITRQGRAYFQVGMNEVFELFQAAWGDAPYTPENVYSSQSRVKQVHPDGAREELWPPKTVVAGNGKTQLQELAKRVRDVAAANGIERVEGIWVPALQEIAGITLRDILPTDTGWDGSGWTTPSSVLQPVMGIKDDPENQRQEVLRIELEDDGHFVLFGAPGAGKTTCLHSLVASMAIEHTPEQVQMYLLDFSGRTLGIFENLPHVGAVITNGETERLRRLFNLLNEEIERRKKLIEHDGTFVKYRKSHPDSREAEIVVVLDGFSHFVDAFKMQAVQFELDSIAKLAGQGGTLGIHLVITTDQVKSFPAKLAANIKAVATLEQNDAADYVAAIGRTGGLMPPKDAPGRGLIKGQPVLEFQSCQATANTLELKALVENMANAWQGTRPRPVPVVPDIVCLSDVLTARSRIQTTPSTGLSVPLGLDLATPDLQLLHVSLNAGPHFWVSGMPQSGKTSLMQTWLLALADLYPPEAVRFFLLDFGWGNFEVLRSLPHVLGCMNDAADLKTVRLQDLLGDFLNVDCSATKPVSMPDPSKPEVIFAVDGLSTLAKSIANDTSKEKIGENNRGFITSMMSVKNANFHMMAAGLTNEFGGGVISNPIGELLKGFQSGFWLGDASLDTSMNLGFSIPANETKTGLSRGTGFYYNHGKHRVVKLATCQAGAPSLVEWLDQIAKVSTPAAAPAKRRTTSRSRKNGKEG